MFVYWLKCRFFKPIVIHINYLHGLWHSEVQCRIHKGSHYSLFWAESSQFLKLITISLRSFLAKSFHLRLAIHKGLFLVGLPVKILKALLTSSILATRPAHLKLLDLITLTILGERYKPWSSSLWGLLHSPISSLLGPNIRLSILFSNTPNLS